VSQLLLALPLGVATGAALGLLGAGGSLLAVPALVYLLDQTVSAATTTTLVVVAAGAAVGAAINLRQGTIDVRLGAGLAAAGSAGALAGAGLARLVDGRTILVLLALLMLVAAWALMRRGSWSSRALAPGPARAAAVAGLGLGIGVLTGFFGVGGGFLVVPALVLVLGLSEHRAVGTSLLVIAVTAAAGLLGHLGTDAVSWPLTLAFGAAAAAGVAAGARAGRALAGESLARAFAAVLVLVAVVLLADNAAAIV
jgi:uncharacterized protein